MKTLHQRNVILALSAAGLAVWGAFASLSVSVGQEARPPASKHKVIRLDEHVAVCLILDNQNEVAAARIAQKKGDDEEVRNFADTMVDDHEAFIAQLEKFAGKHYRARTSNGKAESGETKVRVNEREIAVTATEAHHEHVNVYMRIREEIADRCRASMQRELDEKHGKAFDECYMGSQIVMHMQMVDVLTVLEGHVSSDFRPVLQKGLETAQEHLKNAKQVMKDINEQRGGGSETASEN